MENKIFEAFLILVLFLELFLALYFIIKLVICDYEAWKRNKEEKERCRRLEDKFKNRKLTD